MATYESVLTDLPRPEDAPSGAGAAMLAFGDVPFEAPVTAFQALKRVSEYRHPSQDRVHQRPIHQFTGLGRDSIDLDGVVFPGQLGGGLSHLAALRARAEAGEPRMLVAGTGEIFGKYVLVSIEEQRDRVFADGAPRRVTWRLRFERYGDDAPGGLQVAMAKAADESGDARAVTDAVAGAVADGQSSAGVLAAAEGVA